MTKPIKILVLASDPTNSPPLRLNKEIREIESGLARSRVGRRFVLRPQLAARFTDIRRAMLDFEPNIVHFCGHGAGEEGIVIEDEDGQAKLISTDALRGLFQVFSEQVECVILNACYSEMQAAAIAKYIPFVIGMKGAPEDAAAIEFAVAFYDALGAGKPVEFSFELACNALQWLELRHHPTPILLGKARSVTPAERMPAVGPESLRDDLYRHLQSPGLVPIDNDKRFVNLTKDYWIDFEFINSLRSHGWIRFAAGFKAGIFAHPNYHWCIKILGMGVGEDPAFFCGHGYYLEHERRMLDDFRNAGFNFQPQTMSQGETIDFLVNECGVSREHATARTMNNDILITELITGIPLLTQIGRRLECEISLLLMDESVLSDIEACLELLKLQVMDANDQGLLHNDPVAFNVVLTLDGEGMLKARLVDFELAQNLNRESPGHVNTTVESLYRERNVPFNARTGRHTRNLDQHLLSEAIRIVQELSARLRRLRTSASALPSMITIGPFDSGIEIKPINVRNFVRPD